MRIPQLYKVFQETNTTDELMLLALLFHQPYLVRPRQTSTSRWRLYFCRSHQGAFQNVTIKTLALYRFKVIRHVFGFGIEFLENKDIDIFGHFIVIDFIKRYSYHTYFTPISTS